MTTTDKDPKKPEQAKDGKNNQAPDSRQQQAHSQPDPAAAAKPQDPRTANVDRTPTQADRDNPADKNPVQPPQPDTTKGAKKEDLDASGGKPGEPADRSSPARTVDQGLATGNHPDLAKINEAQANASKQGK